MNAGLNNSRVIFGVAIASALVGAATIWAQPADSVPNVSAEARSTGTESNEDFEILLRGPLHEAFAEPVNFDAQPGIVVAKVPPKPIEELPPEVKPDQDALWIPGYWAWDDDRNPRSSARNRERNNRNLRSSVPVLNRVSG